MRQAQIAVASSCFPILLMGTSHMKIDQNASLQKPARFSPRLEGPLTDGSLPHRVQFQVCQNPSGKMGMKKKCQTGKYRVLMVCRSVPHLKQ